MTGAGSSCYGGFYPNATYPWASADSWEISLDFYLRITHTHHHSILIGLMDGLRTESPCYNYPDWQVRFHWWGYADRLHFYTDTGGVSDSNANLAVGQWHTLRIVKP